MNFFAIIGDIGGDIIGDIIGDISGDIGGDFGGDIDGNNAAATTVIATITADGDGFHLVFDASEADAGVRYLPEIRRLDGVDGSPQVVEGRFMPGTFVFCERSRITVYSWSMLMR